MRVGVVAEQRVGERRVALVPDAVPRLVSEGLEVVVERGAGVHAFASDEAYREAGAEVVDDALDGSDVVLTVSPLTVEQAGRLRTGALTIGFLPVGPTRRPAGRAARARGARLRDGVGAADLARAVDGRAHLTGAGRRLSRAYWKRPAAAEVLPAVHDGGRYDPAGQVLVLGAGVAGLQAIATAKRLGAVVEAYDVRPSSADEVKSMGATFIKLELEAIEGSGGYAREMTEDRANRQQELLTPYIAKSDVLITTAAVPGRPAPLLVTTAMLEQMRPVRWSSTWPPRPAATSRDRCQARTCRSVA